MTAIALDREQKWLTHCAARGALPVTTLPDALAATKPGDTVLLSALMMDAIPALTQAGGRVIVVSGLPSVGEEVAAYRAGAVGYGVKDYREVER